MSVSVLLLTMNESHNIAACLQALNFSDDIVVLDSGSQDETQAIATANGARVVERPFDNWSSHSNWALAHIPFIHDWVYYSDADERVGGELAREVLRSAESDKAHVAYEVRYNVHFLGRRLRFGGASDVSVIRLMRPDRVRYEDRLVNAHPVAAGTVGRLNSRFEHYTFSAGLPAWLHKHNAYSSLEAREAMRRGQVDLGVRGMTIKRRLKNASFRLRARGLARFIYTYAIRCGALDGRPGLHYALLVSIYEDWTEQKFRGDPDLVTQRIDEAIRHAARSEDCGEFRGTLCALKWLVTPKAKRTDRPLPRRYIGMLASRMMEATGIAL